MFTFGKRAAAMVVAGALALGGLAGCGPAEPTNAQELMERYEASQNHGNYHAVLDYDIEMSLMGQSLPITIQLDLDVLNEASHGTMSMSAMGDENSAELYGAMEDDKYVQYVSEDDGSTWAKSTVNSGSTTSKLTSKELLEDAEFQKTDDGYTLTIPGSRLMETVGDLGDMNAMLEELGLSSNMEDAMNEADAVFTFDSNCMPTGFSYSVEFTYDYGSDLGVEDSQAVPLNMTVAIDLKMTVSDHGSVSEDDVAVPDDVKSNAIDTGSIEDTLSELMDDTNSVSDDANSATEEDDQTAAAA